MEGVSTASVNLSSERATVEFDPARAALNQLEWTRPGGLLVIGVPNLWSLRGLITKLTPFWFHRLVYRLGRRKGIYRSLGDLSDRRVYGILKGAIDGYKAGDPGELDRDLHRIMHSYI